MKLEELNVGDILIPNGTFRGVVTKAVHENNIALVVTRIDAPHHFFVAIVVASSDKARVGEKMALHRKDLTCFNVHHTYIEYYLRKENKALYLRWAYGKKTSLGRVGDKTPYKLENGRNLFVGDVVAIKNDYIEVKNCLVVYDEDGGYYVMGIASDCNSKTGEIKNFTVSLERSFSGIKNGDTFATYCSPKGIEVVDFIPEE